MIRDDLHQEPKHSVLDDLALDLTPLLDVLFLLLVFLVLIANSAQYQIDVSLPALDSADTTASSQENSLLIKLYDGGDRWQIDNQAYTAWDDVCHALDKQCSDNKSLKIVLASDKDVKLKGFLKIIHYLQKLGITNIETLVEST
jgi:biopolymer transport protein ExbD